MRCGSSQVRLFDLAHDFDNVYDAPHRQALEQNGNYRLLREPRTRYPAGYVQSVSQNFQNRTLVPCQPLLVDKEWRPFDRGQSLRRSRRSQLGGPNPRDSSTITEDMLSTNVGELFNDLENYEKILRVIVLRHQSDRKHRNDQSA